MSVNMLKHLLAIALDERLNQSLKYINTLAPHTENTPQVNAVD